MAVTEDQRELRPELWYEPAPRHFDTAWPWWLKLGIMLVGLAGAFAIDQRVAAWALNGERLPERGDIGRELGMLEQYGQWTCTMIIIGAVALIDPAGRRRALAIAIGCLATVVVCYLMKDLLGRTRPGVWEAVASGTTLPANHVYSGDWRFMGPAMGFGHGSAYGSFPSAHTTGAFALSAGLAWFYPRARGLFMALALITAGQRVLHHAHYVSDVVAGIIIGVGVTRWTLWMGLAGKLMEKVLPPANADQ